MDQIGKYLSILNTVAVSQAKTSVNPVSGAALQVDASIDEVKVQANDGADEGLTFRELSFTVENLIPPTPTDRSVRVTPVVNYMVLDISPGLYKRAAKALKEPIIAQADQLVDKVVVENLRAAVRLSAEKKLRVDLDLDRVRVCHGDKDCIVVNNVSLSLVDFDLNLPTQKAMAECLVIIHELTVEVFEDFMNRAATVGLSQAPDMVKRARVELAGRKMIADTSIKFGMQANFRVDLSFRTENNLFGIYFDRFYLPGGLPVPMGRSALLAVLRLVENKFRGLVEVTNDYLMINPWPKVPIPIECRFERFEVDNGRLVVAAGPVPGREREDLDAPEQEKVEELRSQVKPPGPPA